MFKIVRALLCVMALALICAGTHASARAEANGSDAEPGRDAFKRGKPLTMLSVRAGATCPLALAVAQTSAARVWAPASGAFVHFFVSSGGVTSVASMTREAERQSRRPARAGVVRLLI